MLDDRNLMSHTYKESLSKKVFENIRTYYPVMQKTYEGLKSRDIED